MQKEQKNYFMRGKTLLQQWVVLGVCMSLTALPGLTQAGLVLTGSEGLPVLDYRLDFAGRERKLDRYRLEIPPQDLAVAEIQISAPLFKGKVDPAQIRLEVEGQPVPLETTFWSQEFSSLEVILKDPVPAGQEMRLILSNVRNPEAGIYRFECRLLGTEANPIFRLVGQWLITVG